MRRIAAALALVAALVAALAAPAAAAPRGELLFDPPAAQPTWHGIGFTLAGPEVGIADLTGGRYPGMVESAVAAWNASGMKLRLVPAPAKRAAIIVHVGDAPFQKLSCTNGVTGVTFGGGAGSEIWIAAGCADRLYRTFVMTHELGHGLGLAHEDQRCATMGSSNLVIDRTCGAGWVRPCRLLQTDDIRAVVALYGGHATSPEKVRRAVCADHAPARLRSIAVTPEPAGTVVDATVVVRARKAAPFGTIVLRRKGRCPAGPKDGKAQRLEATPGSPAAISGGTAAGKWCYAAWPVSRGGRIGKVVRRTVTHAGTSVAARIGLTAVRRADGTLVTWRHPRAPRPRWTSLQVREGGCGAAFPTIGETVAVAKTGKGGTAAQAVDAAPWRLGPGEWCYRLAFTPTDPRKTFASPGAEARVHLVVPAAPPTAAIALDRDPTAVYAAGEQVTATATAADPDGGPVSYSWSTESEPFLGFGATQAFTFGAGDHVIRLEVTDDEGVTTAVTRQLHVG